MIPTTIEVSRALFTYVIPQLEAAIGHPVKSDGYRWQVEPCHPNGPALTIWISGEKTSSIRARVANCTRTLWEPLLENTTPRGIYKTQQDRLAAVIAVLAKRYKGRYRDS